MYKPNSTFHVLYISNVETTHNFYKSINAEITQLEEDKVVVQMGGYILHFVLDSSEPWDEYRIATSKEGRGQGILFYIEVENLETAKDLVKDAGAKFHSEIKENWWNGKEFMFEDPDGYKFVVYKMN